MSICEHSVDRFLTNAIIPSAVVTAAWEFTVAEKSKISASFLKVDERDRVRSKIFNNCDLLPWYICCFFVKHSGRPVISILKTSAQREGRNNAAALNLLKSDSLRVDLFFLVCFCCWFGKSYKIIFRNCIRNKFLASDKPYINKFFLLFLTYFRYSIDESTHFLTICNISSDFDKWILHERIDWEQSSNLR